MTTKNSISMALAITLAGLTAGCLSKAEVAELGTGFPQNGDSAPKPEASPGPAACTPTSEQDRPDPGFMDENCDGIDGTESAAIFVSAQSGNDANPGTLDQPVLTISEGIERAAAGSKKEVYVTGGNYPEKVVLANGISIYGKFDSLENWNRSDETLTRVFNFSDAADQRSIAVFGTQITEATTLMGLTVLASPAVRAGASVYGIYCKNCPGLVLSHNQIESSDAAPGENGASGSRGRDGFAGSSGQMGDCDEARNGSGGAPGRGWSGGSNGGWGGYGGYGREYGDPGQSIDGNLFGGAGGSWGDPGGLGHMGHTGLSGFPGLSASGSMAASVINGFWLNPRANSGGMGSAGSGGGGGGGGGGQYCTFFSGCISGTGGGGGGGGGGGEGGMPGAGGMAGGGSFGVFLVDSQGVKILQNEIKTGSGGKGGSGGSGGLSGSGAPGGDGGLGCDGQTGNGGPGGTGGNGGAGGIGASGTGGPSFGILLSNSTAQIQDSVYQIGNAGLPGVTPGGFSGSAGQAGNIGVK